GRGGAPILHRRNQRAGQRQDALAHQGGGGCRRGRRQGGGARRCQRAEVRRRFAGEESHPRARQAHQPGGVSMLRAKAAAAMTLLTLAGCGFHLAGGERLPEVVARPYLSLKDPYTDFSREFEHQLKISGAVLQSAREGASASIEVTRDQVQQRTLS